MTSLKLTLAETPSRVLDATLRYRLCLPQVEPSALAETPLLLLLHGSGGDELSWDPGLEALQDAVSQGALPPVAAVAPGSGTSWWVDGARGVESAVIGELLPRLEAETGLGKRGVLVAGFSMGGFGAVRYALRYPRLFSGAIALSSALYDDLPPPDSSARRSGAFGTPFDERRWRDLNYPALLEPYRSARSDVPCFIAVGDDDWNEPAGWHYNCEYQSMLLFERLNKEMGSPARMRIDGGGHDWNLWRPMFLEGLDYLLGQGAEELRSSERD